MGPVCGIVDAMRLIRFTAENHRSLRDRAELTCDTPKLTTLRPRAGESWDDALYAVIGIFGANASGKSTVLDAMGFVVSAINLTATEWQARPGVVRAPFVLDRDHRDEPSRYELEFESDGLRYEYGFQLGKAGVEEEWLRYIPASRWKTLFIRDGAKGPFTWGEGVKPLGEVTPRELVMSRAMVIDHPRLGLIARAITDGVDFAVFSDVHRDRRISSIMEELAGGSMTFESVATLLQVADIGITSVRIAEQELPERQRVIMKRILAVLNDSVGQDGTAEGALDEDTATDMMRSFEFSHGEDVGGRPLGLQEESAGTISWLSLAVPAIQALRNGTVLCIDEIDASLHSQLVDVLVGMFENRELNQHGAQLVFTSHDTYLLSNLAANPLEPGQIWFTEKNNEGASELFSLKDFPRHRDANVAKRYLAGRYGAVPRSAPSLLNRVLAKPRPIPESVSQ